MGAPFKIGDRVVAVRDHCDGKFKIGDVFTIHDVRKGMCNCDRWEVGIGIASLGGNTRCTRCGKRETNTTGIWWFSSKAFTKLLSTFSRMTFKEVINEVVTCDN